ncbi:MAG: TIGR03790 family protein, partial [Deltaproteobacteria bacterium]
EARRGRGGAGTEAGTHQDSGARAGRGCAGTLDSTGGRSDRRHPLWGLAFLSLLSACGGGGGSRDGGAPYPGLSAAKLGVLVNAADPQSVAVAAAYEKARGIPPANVVTVTLPTGKDSVDDQTFAAVKAQLDAAAPPGLQAWAVTWTYPYGVESHGGCTMSITSAIAFGFDEAYCCPTAQSGCFTQASPYYDSGSTAPFTDLGIRPAMMLAGATAADASALIARGVASDGARPRGTGYLVYTGDPERSDRTSEYQRLLAGWDAGAGVGLDIVDTEGLGQDQMGPLTGKSDVVFYFTGAFDVPGLTENQYLPGAIGDDDTSFEGQPDGLLQTNCLAWLGAGLVATYGTVVEPGTPTYKMSDVSVLIPRYVRGETALEAYWKSVKYPGEGLFTGEPLARPFGG